MMHGLRTSSVLILDNNEQEALVIQKALATHGIGAVFIDGKPETPRPGEPLTGIRLAVLDIHLGVRTGADKEMEHTTGLVDNLIDEQNGPYVAVVWTKNPDDFEAFKAHLRKIKCPPVLTVQLSKADVLQDPSTSKQAEVILKSIEDALSDAPELKFSTLWEQLVRDAASDTVVSLLLDQPPKSELSTEGDESAKSGSRAMAFLAALLKSETGQGLDKHDDPARALLAALNPVHFDKVEERSTRAAESLQAAARPIKEAAQGTMDELTLAERAQLNTALLFDRQASGLGAGHIYAFKDFSELELGPALPTEGDVRASILIDGYQDRDDCPVFFLEVSAACDHSQDRIDHARLIAGVAIPAEHVESDSPKKTRKKEAQVIQRGERLLAVEPLNIPERNCEVVFVWDALLPVSVSAHILTELDPIGRFREPLVASLRSRIAHHISRPGYASV